MSTFYSKVDGYVAGKRVSIGDPVELTPQQAKYEHVTAEAPKAETTKAEATKAGRKKEASAE